MITFTSVTSEFLNTWKVLPYVELTDIILKYTQNANFIIYIADTVNISNVYLEGLSIKDLTTTYALFSFAAGHFMNAYNVTANNVTGPVFQTTNVLAQNLSTLSFNNMYTSQQLFKGVQIIIYVSNIDNFGRTGLDPSRSRDIFFDNINLNVKKIFNDLTSSLLGIHPH